MEYLTVAEARSRDGIKLVLTRDVPGPWGEAAKAILRHHGLEFLPVAQHGGGANDELVAWTGHRNAPLLLIPGEPVRSHWLEILNAAERLGSGSSLLPKEPRERAVAVGLAHEICGEQALAWQVRLLMLDFINSNTPDSGSANPMLDAYGYPTGFAAERRAVFDRVAASLALLDERLAAQQAAGLRYFVGNAYTVVDLYWAYFSQLISPMEAPALPLEGFRRAIYALYSTLAPELAIDALITHRERIFEQHLELPMSF